ncbi:zinc finger protein 19-like [Uranotaenia lowii]|uniref:zinc finger protein 19-like n=1 Tax=Uranotaenia lowii TaxID=190385 RepID=UPI00247B2B08|nr:zinc finger protein 19-like [Uranotaenia lowii]
MTTFNLTKFPDVCRVCLKPESKVFMIPLEASLTNSAALTVGQFLDEFTFPVPDSKNIQLPKCVCTGCLEELERISGFRCKLLLSLKFMEALVDLKSSNTEPMQLLFQDRKLELDGLFRELALCNRDEVTLDDLLDEFNQFEFASSVLELVPIKEEVFYETKSEDDSVSNTNEDAPDDCNNDPDYDSGDDSDEDVKPEVIYVSEPAKRLRRSRKDRKYSSTSESKSPQGRKGEKKGRGRPRIHPEGSFLKVPWSCDKCKFKTKYRIAVDRHKAVHQKRENRVYPCVECGETFKTYDEMKSHSLIHPENHVVCEVCGVALKNAYSLKAHMERHEDSRKYSCEYCDYSANTKLSLKSHMNIHTQDNKTKHCEVCGVAFRTTSRLKRHMEGHENERKYACEQCPARFNTTNALRNHHIRVHMAIRHPCEHCDKTFDQKIALRDHVERVHHIQTNFVCEICVVTFDSQEKLDVHHQRHSNPKPLECSICLTLHKTQPELDGHLCISYRADYLCCGKDLRNHVQYNRHMATKHGLKTNDRVKPIPGVLLGQMRGARKRLEQCRKCDIAFPSRALKLQHLAVCNGGGSGNSGGSSQPQNSGDPSIMIGGMSGEMKIDPGMSSY